MGKVRPVSVHGGHSGEFCLHAEDSLEEIIQQYIVQGFPWVGITEHAPPPKDRFRYPDEIERGLTAENLKHNFERYIRKITHLKQKYADQIKIFIGFESEGYSNSVDVAKQLVEVYRVDYIVGSVHHVEDICFDFSEKMYQTACDVSGGTDALYEKYFDSQYELICGLEPAVVGHFDLVRVFDADYQKRIQTPDIWKKILRNLAKIKALDLILDFNTRPYQKGGKEPYITEKILRKAKEMKIKVVPGDDSHGINDVGAGMTDAITILQKEGFDTDWHEPRIYQFKD